VSDFDFHEFVTRLYDEATLAYGDAGAKRTAIIEEILPQVAEALKAGHIGLPDIEKMVTDFIVRTDNERNRKRRFADLVPLLKGRREDETILDADFDPWMNQAWALGGGMRRAGRYLSIPDIDAIMSNKRKNATSVVASYEEEAAAADELKAFMRAGNHGHLGELTQS